MELKNQFRVSVPIGEAWAVLTDLERVAPCMPGAELEEIDGQEYRGVVKVKVGPITAQYKGAAWFAEKDDAAHRAVLRAEGGTSVTIVTDLAITGKVAQFGRSIMGDISTKLLGEFAERLEADLVAHASSADGNDGESEGQERPAPSGARPIHSAPAEPVDLLGAAGPSVLKRLAPLAGVLVVVLLLRRRRRR
jgi:hypothetical protein